MVKVVVPFFFGFWQALIYHLLSINMNQSEWQMFFPEEILM